MLDLGEVPYSSVQQREYFVSALMRAKDTGNFPSTPDLVQSFNQLNSTSLPAIASSANKFARKEPQNAAKRRCVRFGVQ